jgi:pimeloyl-ACP methyl ester carboxylesterase
MKTFTLLILVCSTLSAQEEKEVAFRTPDGGKIAGVVRGKSNHGLVLVPPSLNGRDFWSELAGEFVNQGFMTITYDPRGRNESKPGKDAAAYEMDVLGAAAQLKKLGARKVTVIGSGSSCRPTIDAVAGDKARKITQLVVLSPGPTTNVDKVRVDTLIMGSLREKFAKYSDRLYKKLTEKKINVQFDCFISNIHGKDIIDGERGERALKMLVNFLQKGPKKGMKRHRR